MDSKGFLSSLATVLMTADLEATAQFYRSVMGFRAVLYPDAEDPFAAMYRNQAELLAVQAKHGEIIPNRVRYGAGYDVYIVTGNVDSDVDALHQEITAKRGTIVHPPRLTSYGSYEFVVEDNEGRWIGIGRRRTDEAV